MRPLRRLHVFVARRPLVYWSLIALLAAVPAAVVGLEIAEAREARDAWRDRRTILVAGRAIAAGETLHADDVERRPWPLALLPEGAVDSLPDPAVAAAPMAAGEPVVTARLGRPAMGAVASLVPDGSRAVAVARGSAALPVVVGDGVEVIAALDPLEASVVAADAVVVHVDELTAVVAVAAGEAPAAAAAIAAGGAVLAVSSGR
jgi:Flp pilus assembly protein CpaB